MNGSPAARIAEASDVFAREGGAGTGVAPRSGSTATTVAATLDPADAPRSGFPAADGSTLVLDSQRSVTRTRPGRMCPTPRQVWIGASTSDAGAGGFQFVTVPCKTWGCDVCGPRKARELARVLFIDALSDPPRFAITFTTRDPETPADLYRQASAAVWKRLRRRYGRVDYFGFIEFTTGRARRSGGHRRMHGHYLVKFRDAEPDVIEAERLVRETWESVTGAYIVEVAQLVTPGAAFQYLSLHHQKPQQAPPAGWRGMRSRPSRNYFAVPVWKLRQRAREELTIEAIAHRHGISTAEAAVAYHFAALVIEDGELDGAESASFPGEVMP